MYFPLFRHDMSTSAVDLLDYASIVNAIGVHRTAHAGRKTLRAGFAARRWRKRQMLASARLAISQSRSSGRCVAPQAETDNATEGHWPFPHRDRLTPDARFVPENRFN
jgi:hypothetical protein